jgi:hypothetical protein
VAVARLAQRLKTNPELLDDPKWIMRQSVFATLRYLLYPTVSTRRSYWRTESNDVAFFIQTWSPIALQAASRGPGAGLIAGSIFGPLTFAAAAILNGELPPFAAGVRQRIFAHSVGTAIAGVFTANMAKTLRVARADALIEEALQHEVTRALAEKARAQQAFDSWKRSLADLQEAAVRQLQPADAIELLRELDAELAPGAGASVTPRGTIKEVIKRAADDYALSVDLDIAGSEECRLPSLQAVYLVTHSALGNIVKHSNTRAAWISYKELSGIITLTVEDAGLGVPVEQVDFNQYHALGRTQAYLRGLDGDLKIGPRPQKGTIVRATWRNQ